MNIYKIPTINPDLFVFWMYFYGDDSSFHYGERHFLEHMLLGSNSKYPKEEFRKQIGQLGDDGLFTPATSTEFITLSGSYLREDAPRVIELLNILFNEASLLDDEVEVERKIIVQEFNSGVDNLIRQCYQSLSVLLDTPLLAIGTLDSIQKINKEGLQKAYNGVINASACEIYIHGIETDELLNSLCLRAGEKQLTTFKPTGKYHVINPTISSSLVMTMYDEVFSLKSALLASYLSSVNGPLFTELRERQQLCYAVSAMETFNGKLRCPYLTTYGLTTKDPEMFAAKLHEHFVIENKDVYDMLIKGQQLCYARAKNNIEERLAMEKQAKQLGCTFEQLAEWPSWKDFREYAYTIHDKGVYSTMIVESGKYLDPKE